MLFSNGPADVLPSPPPPTPLVPNKWGPLCPVSAEHLIPVPGGTMVHSSRMCCLKQIWSPDSSFLVLVCVYMLASCVPVNQQIWVSACCSAGRRSRLNSWRSEPLSNNKPPSWSPPSCTRHSLSGSITPLGENVSFCQQSLPFFSPNRNIWAGSSSGTSCRSPDIISTHGHPWMADVGDYLLHLSDCCLSPFSFDQCSLLSSSSSCCWFTEQNVKRKAPLTGGRASICLADAGADYLAWGSGVCLPVCLSSTVWHFCCLLLSLPFCPTGLFLIRITHHSSLFIWDEGLLCCFLGLFVEMF